MQQSLPLSTTVTLWKRNRNKGLLFLLGFVFAFMSTQAQTIYPVQSTTRIIPPYSVYLADYAVNGNDKLQCLLVNRDATATTYQVRLRLTVKLNGRVIMQTSPSFNPAPIALTPNSLQLFAGSTLEPYLKSENLEFVGYSQELYEQNRALPEGFYEICFAAFDYFRQDVQVSNDGCGFYFLAKNEPPLINGPACGNKIQPQYSTPIRFSWLPRNTASINSNNSTIYRLFIYEVNPRGTNPNDIVNSLPPIYVDSTNVNQTYYDLLPTTTLFRDSMEYVWRVQAVDINGSDLFRNNGYSQVCTFTWGGPGANPFGAIDSVLNLNAIGETERKGKMWWTKDLTKYDSYKVHYKKSGSGYNWFTSETEFDTLRVFDLEPDTEYECRIQGRKNGSYGIYSEVRYFRTKKIIPKDCDNDSSTAIATSGRPMLNLLKGTTVTYRDFAITVTDFINNGNGFYKGSGTVSIPFLLGLNFAVEFDNIKIDDAGVVSEGEVRFVSNDLQDWINKKIKAENGGDDVGDVITGDDKTDKSVDYDITDPSKIKVLGPVINGVQQPVTNGVADLIITKPDGTTDTLKAVTLPYTIKDKDGDIYSIGKDGKVTKVGKSGAMPGLNPATLNKVQLDKAKVTFKAHPSQQYAFDAWQTAFAGKPIIADEYEKLTDSATNTVYYVPNKAIGASKTDKVIAKIEITDNSIIADSIKFVTAKGTQFESNKTSTANEFEVQLVGGPGGDAQELFAVYKKADSTVITLGKLKVSAYEKILKQIVLVPVQDSITDISYIQEYLKEIYSKINVDVVIRQEGKFDDNGWDINKDGTLDVIGSSLLSQYTAEMKALNRAFKGRRYVDKNKLYLFVMKKSTESNGIGGDMPRGSQFGYLFTEALGTDKKKISRTIAHELGHGVFNLKHTFDEAIGLPKESTRNLMDYTNDHNPIPELYKYQWDQIHDPGIVDKVFASDGEALSVTLTTDYLTDFKNLSDDNYTFITPAGKYITLPKDIQSVNFSTLDRLVYVKNNEPTNDLLPIGSLIGFTDKDGNYYGSYVEGATFKGYLKKDTKDFFYKDKYTQYYSSAPNSGIVLFAGVKTGKFVHYVSRFASIALETKQDAEGLGSGQLIPNLAIINLVLEDMDKTLLEVLTAKKVHTNLNSISDVSIYLSNQDVVFNYLFSEKSLQQFLCDVLSENSKLKDYLGYFTLANLKKNEIQSFATCLASEFKLDIAKTSQAVYAALAKAQFGQSGRLNEASSMLNSIKTLTLQELVGLVSVDTTVVGLLRTAVNNQKSASEIYNIIKNNYKPCAFGGIDFATRKYVLNKLLGSGFDNNHWYTDPSIIGDDGNFILKSLIVSTPLFDQPKILTEGFMANNYLWLRNMWGQANAWFDNGVKYADVIDVFNNINVWVKNHYKDLKVSVTTKKELVSDLGSLQFIEYPAGMNEYYLGMKNNENYPVGNFSLSTGNYSETSDITFKTEGKISFRQNYHIKDARTYFTAPGTPSPNASKFVDYDETFDPFEPVSIIIADNYGELDFQQGDAFTVPAYMAMVYDKSIKRNDRDYKLRMVGDGIMIAAAVFLAPETGGGSLATVTQLMAKATNFVTKVGAVTSALDAAIQTEKTTLTQQQIAGNGDFYKAWDEFKLSVDFANLGIAGANVAVSLYPKIASFNALNSWNRFTNLCRANTSRLSAMAKGTWNKIINLNKGGGEIIDLIKAEQRYTKIYVSSTSKPFGLQMTLDEVGQIFGKNGRQIVTETETTAKEIIAQTGGNIKGDPVLTGLIDNKTGQVFYGRNLKTDLEIEQFLEDMHPILKERLKIHHTHIADNTLHAVGSDIQRAGIPASHSEIVAIDKALKARGATATEADIKDFIIHNRALGGQLDNMGIPIGCPPRCAHCWYLSDEIKVIGND